MQTTFELYRKIRKNVLRAMIYSGLSARDAITRLQRVIPYLFTPKHLCDIIDNHIH